MDWIDIGLVAIICLAIGFIAASLFNNLRNAEAPPPQLEQPEGDDRVEVLRLLRGPDGGALQLEMGGQPLTSAASLDADQHARISLAVVDLYSWLEKANHPAPKLEKQPVPNKATALEPRRRATNKPVKPPSLNVFKALKRTAQSEMTEKIEVAPLSLAAEIDEILQEKLEGSPLAEKGIRLMNLPNQGMFIMLGLEKYPDIDSVPDEEIKAVLREAVADWEARTEGEGRPG